MQSRRFVIVVMMCFAGAIGCGHAGTEKQGRVNQRVAELEAKVAELEHKLKVVESELSRTPRLGLQSAK